MKTQELKNRWLTESGKRTIKEILNCLLKGKPLSSVKDLEIYCGRLDLRGAKLSTLEKENVIERNGYKVSQKFGTLKIKNNLISSIDFSFADISYSYWEKVSVENCLFDETIAKEIRIVASNFNNCLFKKVNFFYSYINQNIGSDSGSFKNVDFIESNLSKCLFYFPLIEDCSFIDCNLKETDFDGSRFKNCLFRGDLDSVWFRGHSKNALRSVMDVFRNIKTKDFRNLMINVDFTGSKLIGVSFSDGIDLTKCYFSNDENYIFILDIHKTFTQVREIIIREWDGEDRNKALAFIDKVYLPPNKKNQSTDLIDKFILVNEGRDIEFGEKIFNLIKSIVNKK